MPLLPTMTPRLGAVLLATACALSTTVAVGAPPAAASPAAVASPANGTRPAAPLRLAGGTRHATSVEVARAAWPSGTTRAVVARADQYADALAGGPLAAAMDAPVLLTDSGSLHPEVARVLDDLGVEHVTVLGGEAAITPQVVDQLRTGHRTVTRLSGPDRWATAAAIAAETVRLRRDPLSPPRVLVVEGANADPSRGWPDAVAAGAWAASTGSPILLTTTGGLPGPTLDALHALSGDLGGVTIVGGPTAVSAEVEVALLRTGLDVDRVAGGDRWATSAAVADRHTSDADVSSVLLTSGRNWPDALVAGPAAAAAGGTLLLTDTGAVPAPIGNWLADHPVDVVAAVGGAAVVADQTLRAAAGRVALPVARRWHDAGTWASGAVPSDGQAVDIPANAAVVVDGGTSKVGRVSVEGRLDLADGGQLDAESVAVRGRMAAGSPLARLDGHARLTLRGRAVAADRSMTGTGGLEVAGGHVTMAGQPLRPFATIARSVPAGTSQVTLSQPATGWRPGDTVLLTATGKDPAQAERRRIAAVDGTTVTLDRPVEHDHVAVSDTIGGLRVHQAGELANLSRTVTLAGAGTGGHVMAMRADDGAGHAPTVQMSNVESVGMGQAGVLARYAFHTHMLGRVDSVRLDTVSVVDSNNRCVTIHGTSGAVVTRLVAHGAAGHCVFLEDGAETANIVAGSLVAGQTATSGAARLVETDEAPAAFWLQHPSNAVFDNIAAGGDGHGFWWDLPAHPTGLSATDRVRPRTAPLGYADYNVAHSQAASGDHRSGTGLRVDDYDPPGPAAFTRHRAWQNEEFGAWLESSTDVVADRFVAVGNATGVQLHGGAVRRATLVGASSNPSETSYFMAGVGLYHGGGDARDVTFANFTTDEDWKHAAAVTGRAHSHHQLARVAGARLVDVPMPLRLYAPWQDDEVAHTGVVDVDGTLTGSAGTYVSQPSMREGNCRGAEVAGASAFRCGTTDPTNLGVLIRDDSGSDAAFGATHLVSGGTRTRAVTDLSFFSQPQIEAVVGTGGTYRVEPGRDLGDNVEVILIGTRAADATLVLPWSAGQVHVYAGWGEWAQPVPATVDGGHVRLQVAAGAAPAGFYERWKVCAVKGCGDGTGSRRQ